MSSFAAGAIAKKFNEKSENEVAIGGWGVSSSWYANATDEEMRNGTGKDLLQSFEKCKNISLARRDAKLTNIRNSIND